MTFRILVVCAANVCRSPMGAAILARRLAPWMPQLVTVESAGLDPWPDAKPCATMRRVSQPDMDGDYLAAHRSQPVTELLVAQADLVLAMDRQTRAEVLRVLPSGHTRTFTLRQAAALMTASGLGEERSLHGAADLPDLVTRLNLRRSLAEVATTQHVRVPHHPWRRVETNTLDVPDAHQLRGGNHRVTAALLGVAARQVAEGLARILESRA